MRGEENTTAKTEPRPVDVSKIDSAMYKVQLVLQSISDNVRNEGTPAEYELRIWEFLLQEAHSQLHKA